MAKYEPTDEELIQIYKAVSGRSFDADLIAYARAVLAMAKEPPPLSTTFVIADGRVATVTFVPTLEYPYRLLLPGESRDREYKQWRNIGPYALDGIEFDKLAALAKRVEERGL